MHLYLQNINYFSDPIYSPFKNSDIDNDTLRIKKIDKIYRDLRTLITFAKFINYRILIIGDFNARIKNETGDKDNNINGIEKFLPFLESNNLKIRNPFGIKTCKTHNGSQR